MSWRIWKNIYKILGIDVKGNKSKKELLKLLQKRRVQINNSYLADVISYAMYYDKIEKYIPEMPEHIQARIKEIQEAIL